MIRLGPKTSECEKNVTVRSTVTSCDVTNCATTSHGFNKQNCWWFTESCDSQCLSHFDASFIVRKHAFNSQVVQKIIQPTMLITLHCRLHRCSRPDQKICFQQHPNTNPDTEHSKRSPQPLSQATPHPTPNHQTPTPNPTTQQHATSNHRTTQPNRPTLQQPNNQPIVWGGHSLSFA